MTPLRVFTAFSGYDSQCLALNRLGLPYELVGWSEIDKYAIQAHNALFPQWSERNYGDISKIDWSVVPDFDLFTYSSPCQDFSNAGLQRGAEEGSGTRSSLLWECRRAIIAKRPKYLLFENVAAVVSKKFMPLFQKWIAELDSYGYENFWQLMNAKDFGIPQNRKRLFMVSILRDGIEPQPSYEFPEPFALELRLKDVLEQNVDEKYYLSDKAIDGFTALQITSKLTMDNREVIQLGNIVDDTDIGFKNPQRGRIYSTEGKAPCLNCCGGGGLEAKIVVYETDRDIRTPRSKRRGKVGRWMCNTLNTGCQQGVVVPINSDGDSSRTIKAQYAKNSRANFERQDALGATGVADSRYRIRKLTPRECFRLMGVDDADIDKIQAAGISNSQQYKMAGNSIVVDNLYHIFRTMFVDKPATRQVKQLTRF